MENKSLAKKFLGEWSTKTIVAIAIGAALYGVLMVPFRYSPTPTSAAQ